MQKLEKKQILAPNDNEEFGYRMSKKNILKFY